jgi:hypothetical protein
MGGSSPPLRSGGAAGAEQSGKRAAERGEKENDSGVYADAGKHEAGAELGQIEEAEHLRRLGARDERGPRGGPALDGLGVELGHGMKAIARDKSGNSERDTEAGDQQKAGGKADARAYGGVHASYRAASLIEGEGSHGGGKNPADAKQADIRQTKRGEREDYGDSSDQRSAANGGLPVNQLGVQRGLGLNRGRAHSGRGTLVVGKIELGRAAMGAEWGDVVAVGELSAAAMAVLLHSSKLTQWEVRCKHAMSAKWVVNRGELRSGYCVD